MPTANASAMILAAAAPEPPRPPEHLSDLSFLRRTAHRAAVALLTWSLRRTTPVDHRTQTRVHRNQVALEERERHALQLEPFLAHRH